MPGGNTSSRKRPYRNLKGASQLAPDVKALSGGETFGSEANMKLDTIPGEYREDTEFGLSNVNPAPENTEDTQGNAGWNSPNVGKPAMPMITPPKKSDATPGGGW